MKPDKENLDQLLHRFYDDETAGQMQKDIHAGDALFHSFDVPAPDDAAVAKIAQRMEKALGRKKSRKGLWYMFASSAAVILFAAGILFFSTDPAVPPAGNDRTVTRVERKVEDSFWTDETLDENVQVAAISREIEDIERSLHLLSRGESIVRETALDSYDYENEMENYGLTELEIEILDYSESFWKG